jgi:uncharacterized protein (UPF0335 family)
MGAGLVDGVGAKKVCGFVEEIENYRGQQDRLREKCSEDCSAITESITAVYSAAKDAGVNKKALKKVVRTRELERKAKAEREKLEGFEQDTFDKIRLALGDLAELPLGQAALRSNGRTTPEPAHA